MLYRRNLSLGNTMFLKSVIIPAEAVPPVLDNNFKDLVIALTSNRKKA